MQHQILSNTVLPPPPSNAALQGGYSWRKKAVVTPHVNTEVRHVMWFLYMYYNAGEYSTLIIKQKIFIKRKGIFLSVTFPLAVFTISSYIEFFVMLVRSLKLE